MSIGKVKCYVLILAIVVSVLGIGVPENVMAETLGTDIVMEAECYIGKLPYVYGGNSLSTGADCSGFICAIFDKYGYNLWNYRTNLRNLPSSIATNIGSNISNAQPGDIITTYEKSNGYHVGIYAGNNYIINAANSKEGVVKKYYYYYGTLTAITRVNGVVQTKSSVASSSNITVNGAVSPTGNLAKGSSFGIRGIISSTYKLKAVEGVIYNSAGTIVMQKSVNPNSTSYNLSGAINNALTFNTLGNGSYTYVVNASDTNGYTRYNLVKSAFTIGGGNDTPSSGEQVKAASYNANAALTYAQAHWNDGQGQCAEFVSRCVRAGGINISVITTTYECYKAICSATGVAGQDLKLNSSGYATYADNSSILAAGDVVIQWCYTHNLRPHILLCGGYGSSGQATFYSHNAALNNKPYRLNLNTAYQHNKNCNMGAKVIHIAADLPSAINAYDTVYPTGTLTKGSSFGIRGVIYSNHVMTNVTGNIINSSGKAVIQKSVNPNSKSYDLRYEINNALTFNTLPDGNYTYRVDATDIKGATRTVIESKFVVGTGDVPEIVLPSAINASDTVYPTGTLDKGNYFGIRGVIYSNYIMTNVTGNIINSSGSVVIQKSVNPNSKSYDLKYAINNALTFNTLSDGNYTYRVDATDIKGFTRTVIESNFIIGTGDPVKNSTEASKITDKEQNDSNHGSVNEDVIDEKNEDSIRDEEEQENQEEQEEQDAQENREEQEEQDTQEEQPDIKERIDISTLTIPTISKRAYTGKAITPRMEIKYRGKALRKDVDYELTYKNNINIGTASVKITGVGDYKGEVTKSFQIFIKKNTIAVVGTNKYRVISGANVTVAETKSKNIKTISVPDAVEIGGQNFKVTEIADNAFKGCKSKNAIIGTNVKKIGKNAFAKCRFLKKITIPVNVTSIGEKAFCNDKSLKTIVIESSDLKKVGKKALKGIDSEAKIKVPAKKLNAYRKLLKNKGQVKKVKIIS